MSKFMLFFYTIIFLLLKIFKLFIFFLNYIFINIIDFMILINYSINFLNNYFNISFYVIQEFNYTLLDIDTMESILVYDMYFLINYIIFIIQVLFIVIITIWTRAAGPRFRLDQLLSITWKDLFIFLSLFLIFFLIIVIII